MPKWNDPGVRWNSGFFWNGDPPGTNNPVTLPGNAPTPNTSSTMEYWEETKNRAQLTRAAWEQYVPALKIGTQGFAELETLIGQFEPLAQERTTAQDDLDAAYRTVQASLLKMKSLGTKVPKLIEGQLDGNEAILRDLNDVYRTNPRTEATILKRARELYPVWVRANTALAALTPAQPAITRTLQGTAYTAAMLKTLLDNYTALIATNNDKQEVLDTKRTALRTLDRETDQLNKRWYKFVKASYDPGSPEYEALSGIPTEPGTPLPETIEIDTVTQGGDEGRQVLVNYVAGGGDHATVKKVRWRTGAGTGFPNEALLDASGNALGPFPVGTVVTIITEVINSSGTRTTAPRTIIIEEPI